MKQVVLTALAGATLMVVSATSSQAASCQQLDYGVTSSASISGASATACMTTDRGNDFVDAHVISTHTKRSSTVVGAKIACRKFKAKNENRQVRASYDSVLSNLENEIRRQSDTSDAQKSRALVNMVRDFEQHVEVETPTYTCGREGRTNHFTVEFRYRR